MVLEPKTKYPKGEPDILRRLPVMRLSMVVQRLLDMERSKAKQVSPLWDTRGGRTLSSRLMGA
jgi:hypothetical protein